MPIASIAEIKASIVRSEDLLEKGVPIHLDSAIVTKTNCYAYSMGIMYNTFPDGQHFYVPGFTEGKMYDIESLESLLENIKQDLKNIGIKFQEYQLEEKPKPKENEYLVKLFYAAPCKNLSSGDFHFVRQDKKSGKWFHKMGWLNQPAILQSDSQYEQVEAGSEPASFISHDIIGEVIATYKPVSYFIIMES